MAEQRTRKEPTQQTVKNEGGTSMSTPLTINSVETLQEALPIIRASQEAYSTFTQEQVDAICEKTDMAVSKMRIPLAKMACEETGYGIVVDKVTKNQYASEHVWNYMRNKKKIGRASCRERV